MGNYNHLEDSQISRPKVCYIARQMLYPPAEGNHVASREIIEAAFRAGISTHVITIEPEEKLDEIRKDWTVVHPKVNFQNMPAVFYPVNDLLASFEVIFKKELSECDLAHILNLNKEAYLLAHALLKAKKPLLIHFYHSPHVLGDDVFIVRNIALKFGLYGRLMTNHVVTVNLSMLRFVTEKLGIDSEHVHFVPYPVNIDKFKPLNTRDELRRKYNLPTDRFILSYIGSIQPARGISILLRAFRHVIERVPKTILFISHPKRKEERTYERCLEQQIRNLGIEDNIIVQGPVNNVEEIYNLADVIVLPLIRPYWVDPPLVLLEAMSSGSAVVTTSVGAIGEIVENYKNALLVEPGNPVTLAEAIAYLLENPLEILKIGRNARKTIVQDYSYDSVGERLSKIYRRIFDNLN
jgi:glycosyltransferase involved in cell wall biosynthesis